MILIYVSIGILSAVGYVYRRRILWWLLSTFWYLGTLYVSYKLTNKRKQLQTLQDFKITGKQIIPIEETTSFFVYEYQKDRIRMIVFGCQDETPMSNMVEEKIKQNLIFKHNVLNCSINDESCHNEDNCLLDITNRWRECLYHYQDSTEPSKLKYFFTFISSFYGIQNIKDKYLVTYHNDDTFSQHTYKIAEIWDKYFYELNNIGDLYNGKNEKIKLID